MAKVTAYLLRVDELSGVSYQGYLAEVEDSLEAYQDYVNYGHPHGRIQAVEVGGLAVVCNAEGKAKGYPPNRLWLDGDGNVFDAFVGNILCVREGDGGGFASILPEDIPVIERYLIPMPVQEGIKVTVREASSLPEYGEG